jgi:hypothetical protein
VHGQVPQERPGIVRQIAGGVGSRVLQVGGKASEPVVHAVENSIRSRIARALGAF